MQDCEDPPVRFCYTWDGLQAPGKDSTLFRGTVQNFFPGEEKIGNQAGLFATGTLPSAILERMDVVSDGECIAEQQICTVMACMSWE